MELILENYFEKEIEPQLIQLQNEDQENDQNLNNLIKIDFHKASNFNPELGQFLLENWKEAKRIWRNIFANRMTKKDEKNKFFSTNFANNRLFFQLTSYPSVATKQPTTMQYLRRIDSSEWILVKGWVQKLSPMKQIM